MIGKPYSAVVREFEIIGEAVGKLPEEIKLMKENILTIKYSDDVLFSLKETREEFEDEARSDR